MTGPSVQIPRIAIIATVVVAALAIGAGGYWLGMSRAATLEYAAAQLEAEAATLTLDEATQEQIDLLIRELTHLRQQAPEPGTARNLRDELPPHY